MSKAIQRRRGTTSEHSTFTGLVGELTVDTTLKTVMVHDGTTAGGTRLAKYSDIGAATDYPNTTSVWTKGQDQTAATLSSTSNSVAVDLSAGPVFTLSLTEDTTIAAPSNKPASGDYRVFFIMVTQHASSAKTLGWNTVFKFAGGTVPTMSTGSSAVDVYTVIASNGNLYVTSVQDMK
jgi:hypothetical protein